MFSLTSMVMYSSSKPRFLKLQKTSFVAKILSYTHSETVPPTERKADNRHYEACFTGDSSEWVLNLLDNKKCTGVRHHQAIPSFGWNRERTPCRQSEGETICTWTISLLVSIEWTQCDFGSHCQSRRSLRQVMVTKVGMALLCLDSVASPNTKKSSFCYFLNWLSI